MARPHQCRRLSLRAGSGAVTGLEFLDKYATSEGCVNYGSSENRALSRRFFGLIGEMRVLLHSRNQRGPTSAVSSPWRSLHRNRGASDTSNSQDLSAKAFTGFALEAGTPEFLCKGVCLGGALHRNPGMKRTETRDFEMSLLLRRRPRRAKASKPRIWRAGLPCIGRADPSDGSRWHNYLAVSFFLRLKLQSHSDLRLRGSPPRGLAASSLGGELGVVGMLRNRANLH